MLKNIVFFIWLAFCFVVFIVFPLSMMLEKYLHKTHADDDTPLSISIGGNEMDAKEAAEVLANAISKSARSMDEIEKAMDEFNNAIRKEIENEKI